MPASFLHAPKINVGNTSQSMMPRA